MDKLEICKQTRKFAADSLHKVLKKLLESNEPISEMMLRDAWLAEMRENKNIFPDGWYTPPPHGMIILFATDKDTERFNYKNARNEVTWPKNDIFLDKKNGVIFCYASPVDKKTGMIGDFGITLYFGDNDEIKQLTKDCLYLDKEIFDYAQIGIKISEVAVFAEKRIHAYEMTNEIISITDKFATNIGHGIPTSNENWNAEEKQILQEGDTDWESTKDMISKKRFFVNNNESLVIKPQIAFTIEPRPKVVNKPHLPSSICYHTIALFKESGEKELLTDFDDLFTLVGMDYMIEQ